MPLRGRRLLLLLALCCSPGLSLAARVVVTGVVVGPDGNPVARASVGGHAFTEDGAAVSADTAADDEGRFAITLDAPAPVTELFVAAVAPGLLIGGAKVAPGDEVTIRLGANAVEVTGTVVSTDNKPIAGVRLSASSVNSGGAATESISFLCLSPGLLATTTDAEGRFRLGHLPADGAVTLDVHAKGFARPDPYLELAEGTKLDLVLSPEAIAAGRVLHDGQPVAGATVTASELGRVSWEFLGEGQAVTGADGNFEIRELGNGLYGLEVDPPAGLAPTRVEDVPLTLGQRTTVPDFALTPGALLRGQVTVAGTGAPLPGFGVRATAQGPPGSAGLYVRARTGADGSYELRLPPGEGRVYLKGRDGYTSKDEQWRRLEVAEGQVLTGVDFEALPPRTVPGVVLGPDGHPATGVELTWDRLAVIGPSERLDVGQDGTFELPASAALSLRSGGVAVVAHQAEPDLFAYVPVPPDAERIEVRLQPASYILVRATDTDGRPLPDRKFAVSGLGNGFSAPGGDTMFLTDAQGAARLGPVPPGLELDVIAHGGQHDYLVNREEWGRASRVTLAPGETRELPALVLNLEGRQVRVWVGDDQGRPVPGALVVAGQRDEAVRTDREGRATVTKLPLRDQVGVVAMHPTDTLFGAAMVDPVAGDELRLTLYPPCEAEGQVIGAGGEPLAGLWLHFSPVGSANLWGMYLHRLFRDRMASLGEASVRTDEQGRWHTSRFLAGLTYEVRASRTSRGSQDELGTFAAQGGGTANAGVLTYAD
jgi:hypothetical protein